MRWLAGIGIVLAVLIGGGVGFWSVQQSSEAEELALGEEHPCFVSEAYREAVDENILNAQRLIQEAGIPDSSLNSADTAALFYSQITSSRRYHEAQQRRLPECAHEFNAEYTAMLAGLQDVIALKLSVIANPGNARQASLEQQALNHVNEQWLIMSEALRDANLQVVPIEG